MIQYQVRQSVRHIITKYETINGKSSLSTVCELDNWERAIELAKHLANNTPGGSYADNYSQVPEIPSVEPEIQSKRKQLQCATKPFIIVTWNLDLAHKAMGHWSGKDKWEAKITKTQQLGKAWHVFVSLSYTCRGANNHDLVTSAKEAFKDIFNAHDTSYVNFDGKCITKRLYGEVQNEV